MGTRVVDAPAALLEHEAFDSRVLEKVVDIRGVEERDKLAVSQIVQFQAAAPKLVDLSGRSLSAVVKRPQFAGRTHSDAFSSDRISMMTVCTIDVNADRRNGPMVLVPLSQNLTVTSGFFRLQLRQPRAEP